MISIPFAFVSILLMILIRPLILIRVGFLHSDRIGHFAANTELYLCEKDLLDDGLGSIDLFYFARKPCNMQLARMWSRELIVFPKFFLRPIDLVVRSFECLSRFKVERSIGGDRDIYDVYGKTLPHLSFTKSEIEMGESILREMGIPKGRKFICMTVRDSSYLKKIYPKADTSYQDYRDSNIDNYIKAAEALAEKGYFVIRMGAIVNASMKSNHPLVIDYATNGMRSDFMDIYLGANCEFCITTQTGFDAVPVIFRKPIVQVNAAPLGYCYSWGKMSLILSRHHVDVSTGKKLTLSEIFSRSVGYSITTNDFKVNGVELIENSPEEIRDIALEMVERLEETWVPFDDDEHLQKLFWGIFPLDGLDLNGVPLHSVLKCRFGAHFLRKNQTWLS